MIQVKRLLQILIVLFSLVAISGCWNYVEVDDLSIVAGVAIDKNPADGKLLLTVELIDTKGGTKQTQAGYKTISLTGDTMFEIVRNMISMTGKKLFWSHAKVIIISEEVARSDGVIRFIDWYTRDTETRADVFIFVSKEKTAREILDLQSTMESITSFELAQMMRDEKYVSSAPTVEIWDFIDKLESRGKCAIAPLVYIHQNDTTSSERVNGTAVFSKDRMVGTLSGEESKYMLFAKNDIKGGILPVKDETGKPSFSLEIISSQTKIKPILTLRESRFRLTP
ncbi:Ger(x)C family spore germination protein [Paenibacillus sp. FSL K6-2524]|uniref:Ger(x)C family spore germination protein n=1 Tax=Paenibacillus sp. FSL K6-2524 TaxID=2954516 RepID=UPI0030F95589